MIELPVTEWTKLKGEDVVALDWRGQHNLLDLVRRLHGYDVQYSVTKEFQETGWLFTSPKGTLVTRIKRVLYKQHKLEISKELLECIAEEVMRCKNNDAEWRITDRLDWQAGEYGDAGSCFWTMNARYLAGLVSAGTGAILLRTKKRGFARAFLAPHESGLMMFNLMGTRHDVLKPLVLSALPEPETVKVERANYLHYNFAYGGAAMDKGFYHHYDLMRFYRNEKEVEKPKVLQACRCFCAFSGKAYKEVERTCPNCPFTDAQLLHRKPVREEWDDES